MITTHRWLWLWQYPHEGSPDRSARLLFDLFWGKELLSGKWRDRWKLGHVWKALLRVFSWKLFLKRDQTSCSEQKSNIELENSKSSLRREPMMGRIRKMWANHFDWVYQPYNWVGIPPSKQTLRQLQSGQCCILLGSEFCFLPKYYPVGMGLCSSEWKLLYFKINVFCPSEANLWHFLARPTQIQWWNVEATSWRFGWCLDMHLVLFWPIGGSFSKRKYEKYTFHEMQTNKKWGAPCIANVVSRGFRGYWTLWGSGRPTLHNIIQS